jgi:hypothetical protein
MNKQLLSEAQSLLFSVKALMWESAGTKKVEEFNRRERIYQKCLDRYERRYNKWVELQS